MISHSKKFIFVHIPKTGGSSVEVSLSRYSEQSIKTFRKRTSGMIDTVLRGKPEKHASAMEIKKIFPDIFDSYFKISVIREPLERLLSLYFWVHPKIEFNRKEFLDWFQKSRHKRALWSINKFICDENNNLIVDKVVKFNNLTEGFEQVVKHLNIEAKLPHLNKSKNSKYKQYIDSDLRLTINSFYQQEVKDFWT